MRTQEEVERLQHIANVANKISSASCLMLAGLVLIPFLCFVFMALGSH
jgi:hypothetical protein